jgi:hypothetical protein
VARAAIVADADSCADINCHEFEDLWIGWKQAYAIKTLFDGQTSLETACRTRSIENLRSEASGCNKCQHSLLGDGVTTIKQFHPRACIYRLSLGHPSNSN